jgi:microcystin-dependent protein
MADAFMSEIRMMAFPFAPRNWAVCEGATMGISQNQALFALLGTTYGGNGVTTFMLPKLSQSVPVHRSTVAPITPMGFVSGEAAHTLVQAEVPGSHSHAFQAVTATGDQSIVNNNSLASAPIYAPASSTPTTTLNPAAIPSFGGVPHENRQPYLAVKFCICLYGLFPPRS